MCRIAGYIGPDTTLASLLTEPSHSLCTQAKRPREMPAGAVGSDGHGVAWWNDIDDSPARYRHTLPIWSDQNLDGFARHVRSRAFVASTRTASETMPVALSNTPPFVHPGLALVHNGEIEHFHERVSDQLRLELTREARGSVLGNTDSELIAALVASCSGADLTSRVRAAFDRLGAVLARTATRAQLNVIVSDGLELVVVRSGVGKPPPSLYASVVAGGGARVASEPLDDGETWERVAAEHVLTLTRSGTSRLSPL